MQGSETPRPTEKLWAPDEIENLNYATSSQRLGLMNQARRRREPGWAWSIVRFLAGFVRAWLWRTHPKEITPTRFLAAVESANQQRVFEALGPWENLTTVAVAVTARRCDLRLPLHQAYLASLRWLPTILRARRSAQGYKKLGWRYQAQEYALTPGYYAVARRFIAALQPTIVLVANDHNMRLRAFERAARDEGLRTAYIQHASVTERFPPLCTTYAFLDGVDALRKYLTAGDSTTTTFLTGSPLHDSLIGAGHAAGPSQNVGLCLNLLDEVPAVQDVVRRLGAEVDAKLLIRTHPRDTRPWRELLPGVQVSSALDEPMSTYLERVGIVLAGESNVHLEAAIFGRPSAVLDLAPASRDNYGFAVAGIVTYVSTTDLVDVVREKLAAGMSTRSRERLSYFSATIGTEWEGRSGELVRQLLSVLAEGAPTSSLFPYSYEIGRMKIRVVSALTPDQLDFLGAGELGVRVEGRS